MTSLWIGVNVRGNLGGLRDRVVELLVSVHQADPRRHRPSTDLPQEYPDLDYSVAGCIVHRPDGTWRRLPESLALEIWRRADEQVAEAVSRW